MKKFMSAWCLLALGMPLHTQAQKGEGKPNIIFILADDMG